MTVNNLCQLLTLLGHVSLQHCICGRSINERSFEDCKRWLPGELDPNHFLQRNPSKNNHFSIKTLIPGKAQVSWKALTFLLKLELDRLDEGALRTLLLHLARRVAVVYNDQRILRTIRGHRLHVRGSVQRSLASEQLASRAIPTRRIHQMSTTSRQVRSGPGLCAGRRSLDRALGRDRSNADVSDSAELTTIVQMLVLKSEEVPQKATQHLAETEDTGEDFWVDDL